MARLAPVLLTCLALVAAGCGGDGGTGPDGDIAGRYDIVRVNDDTTPPFLLFEETSEGSTLTFELTSGSFDLDDDGTYVSRATVRFLVDGQSQGTEPAPPQTGRYTVSGSTVVFDPTGTDPDEPNFEAEHDGGTLTFSGVDSDTGAAVTIVAQR